MHLRLDRQIPPNSCPCPYGGHVNKPIYPFNMQEFSRFAATLYFDPEGPHEYIGGAWPPPSTLFYCYQCNILYSEAEALFQLSGGSGLLVVDSNQRFWFNFRICTRVWRRAIPWPSLCWQ